MQDRDHQDQLADLGWDQMRELLDKEMPVRRRALFWWWLLPVFLAVAGGAVFAWYASETEREAPILPLQQPGPDALPGASPPQAHQEVEAFPSSGQKAKGDPSSSGSVAGERSKGLASVRVHTPDSYSGKRLLAQNRKMALVQTPPPGLSQPGTAGQNEAKEPVPTPFSESGNLPSLAARRPRLTIPQRQEQWEFSPAAAALSKPEAKKWSFLGEASAMTNMASQNPQTGAGAGVQVGKPVSDRLAVVTGLSLERFSSTVQTPFSGTATVMDVTQPTFGTPNRGSTVVALAEEVPVRSWGIYLPVLAQVRVNRHWRLEGGARIGYLMNYSLGASLAPEQLRESTPVLAAAAESPFAGSKGEALDPDLFRSVDTQLSLEAGRDVGKHWVAYARYRQGLGNAVKVDQYEVRFRIIQIGMKYRFGQ